MRAIALAAELENENEKLIETEKKGRKNGRFAWAFVIPDKFTLSLVFAFTFHFISSLAWCASRLASRCMYAE